MKPSHPTFARGHCFMVKTLNKQEVEFVGEMLHEHLKKMRLAVPSDVDPSDNKYEVRRVNAILDKMDHPLFEEPTA